MPRESHLPIYLPYAVAPTSEFRSKVKSALTSAEVNVVGAEQDDDAA